MKKTLPSGKPSVHFIGIGGIGMSALAQWFLARNWAVSGSDIAVSEITRDLARHGIRVKIGQKAANVPKGAELVVRTQAIGPLNPEYATAKTRGIPVFTYPEVVGWLTHRYAKTVAIAGAHGKSTTTALAALMLTRAKFDPTVLVGTRLKEFGGNNFRKGRSDWLVLEADEYGRAFHHYAPLFAVITNIDAEHLDTYGDLHGVKKAFLRFIHNIQSGGTLIANRDDANLYSLKTQIRHVAKSKGLRVVWYSLRDAAAKQVARVMQLPGVHNRSNGAAILALARVLGIPQATALRTLREYSGSWRRFDYRGECNLKPKTLNLKASVYDDYAHHPSEIRATLQGFREKFPNKKILCVFQPHQAERLKRLWNEFQDAFLLADTTLLIPTYKVAGRDAEHSVYSARGLAAAIQKRHPKQRVFFMETPKNLRSAVTTLLQTMDEVDCVPSFAKATEDKPPHLKTKTSKLKAVIVMMGAGDIVEYTGGLIKNEKIKM